jgi:hypothetical protein
MRSIRSVRMKKLVRGNKSSAAKKSDGATRWGGRPATAAVVIGLMMVVAVVIAVYEPSEPTSIASVRAGADETLTETELPPVTGSSSTPAAARMRQPTPPTANASSTETASDPTLPTANASSTETASDPTLPSVTITGCLERSKNAFRLRDTAGAQAPKARSWKSGFLKKASTSVGVVAAAERLSLSSHVGERVSVTGTLVDREIRARSLQRVAPSCSGGTKLRT